MKLRHFLAIGLSVGVLIAGTACQQSRVTPVAISEAPQLTPEQIAEQAARKKKLQAQRLAKIRTQSHDALERGRDHLRDEQHEDALREFREAVRLDRESVDAWIRIAFVYEQEGDDQRAAEAFREVKRLWSL